MTPPSVYEELRKDHPNQTYADLYAASLLPIFQEMCHISVEMGAEHEPDMTAEKVGRYQIRLQRLHTDLERYKQRHFS